MNESKQSWIIILQEAPTEPEKTSRLFSKNRLLLRSLIITVLFILAMTFIYLICFAPSGHPIYRKFMLLSFSDSVGVACSNRKSKNFINKKAAFLPPAIGIIIFFTSPPAGPFSKTILPNVCDSLKRQNDHLIHLHY